MMTLIVLLAVVAQSSAEETRSVIINERIEHFEVPGRNYQRFYDHVEEYGPSGRFSEVRYSFNARWRYQQDKTQCSLDQVQLVFDVVYHLPQWDRLETANERERAEFARMYATEMDFLRGYTAALEEGGERLADSLLATQPMACPALDAHLNLQLQYGAEMFENAFEAYESTAHEVDRGDTSCRRARSRISRC